MPWCSLGSLFSSFQEFFINYRYTNIETNTPDMQNKISCHSFFEVPKHQLDLSSADYFAVTNPPHGLGKRIMVARPGLVVVKNASNVAIRTCRSHRNIVIFYPTCPVLTNATQRCLKFSSKMNCCHSPLVRQIMKIKGIANVSLAADHIKVEREATDSCTRSWSTLKPIILATLMDFFASDLPVYLDNQISTPHNGISSESCDCFSSSNEISAIANDLVNSRIRPFVQDEGGDVVFKSFDPKTGSALLKFYGNCLLNAEVLSTLKKAILTLLQFYIPQVTNIKQVESTILGKSKSSYF